MSDLSTLYSPNLAAPQAAKKSPIPALVAESIRLQQMPTAMAAEAARLYIESHQAGQRGWEEYRASQSIEAWAADATDPLLDAWSRMRNGDSWRALAEFDGRAKKWGAGPAMEWARNRAHYMPESWKIDLDPQKETARIIMEVRKILEDRPDIDTIDLREALLAIVPEGVSVPRAQTIEAARLKYMDWKTWYGQCRRIRDQAREQARRVAGMIRKGGQEYCGDQAIDDHVRREKRRRAQEQTTYLWRARDNTVVTVADVKTTPAMRRAKNGVWTSAVERIGKEQGLHSAMVTLTLEPEWHSSPSREKPPSAKQKAGKKPAPRWNGATPEQCRQEFGKRIQRVRRDLDNIGIKLTGKKIPEPHASGTPHYHVGVMYRPALIRQVQAIFLRYFPMKMRVRIGGKEEKKDIIIESEDWALAGISRRPYHKNEGAQIDWSVVDPKKGSLFSYIAKYEQKYEQEDVAPDAPRAAHAAEPWRRLWRFHRSDWWGLPGSSWTAWDEFRRLNEAPEDEYLAKCWRLARLGTPESCYQYIQATGGLACAPSGEIELQIWTEDGENEYGETIERVVGVQAVRRVRHRLPRLDAEGEIRCYQIGRRAGKPMMEIVEEWQVVAQVRTRLDDWEVLSESELLARKAEEKGKVQEEKPSTGAGFTVSKQIITGIGPRGAGKPAPETQKRKTGTPKPKNSESEEERWARLASEMAALDARLDWGAGESPPPTLH